jgi:hypothetical protein
VVISKCLDLFKGPSFYKRYCLQDFLRFVSKHKFVEPNVQLRLHKECLELSLVTVVHVRQ